MLEFSFHSDLSGDKSYINPFPKVSYHSTPSSSSLPTYIIIIIIIQIQMIIHNRHTYISYIIIIIVIVILIIIIFITIIQIKMIINLHFHSLHLDPPSSCRLIKHRLGFFIQISNSNLEWLKFLSFWIVMFSISLVFNFRN